MICLKPWIITFLNFLERISIFNIQLIDNYYNVPNLYKSSGQPSKRQLKLLAKKGYQIIINLAPNTIINGRILNEAEILRLQKVKYIHIPVDFKNPTKADFRKFVLNIEKYKDEKIWVHCAANMRVSAFTYKYRRDILKLAHKDIIGDLEAIWIPDKVWSSFLGLEYN